MAQSTSSGPFVSVYEDRIGTVTNANEVMGYWTFLVGVVFGLLGLVVYFSTGSATTGRGVGYALAALAPAMVMTGAILRFPLRKMATYLVGLGGLVTLAAVAWFLTVFPGGWSTTTGHTGVIVTYVAGLGIMGVAGGIVPLATDPRETAAQRTVDAANADAAAARRDDADAKRESDRAASERESALRSEMAELERENAELRTSEADEADLERTIDELRGGIADTEADEADLAAQLRMLRASQAQFEQYEDGSGEYRWRLRHRNGNLIAESGEGYTQRHNAQAGMQSVRRNALGATTLLVESEADLPETGTTERLVVPAATESQAAFELYEDTAAEYRWRLRHENGDVIAGCGEGYASRSGAKSSIDRIRAYVGPAEYLHPDPTAIEVYRDTAGEWRWRLVHRNGNILAGSGEGYASRSGASRAIQRLREGIGDVEIEVYEDDAGGFRWRLAGGDGRVKADSGRYESREGAAAAVERVRTFMPDADLIDIGEAAFEVYEDEGGEYRWRLRHRNGNVLADGREGYSDRSGAWRGIESVKRNAPNANLVE